MQPGDGRWAELCQRPEKTPRPSSAGRSVRLIPNAVTNLPMSVVAILTGTAVSTLLLGVLKRPVETAVAAPTPTVANPATD